MRIVTWTIRLVVFLLLVGLAAKNIEPVKLQFYFDLAAEAPLVLWLFAAFVIGALFGVAALLPTVLRQRRDISQLRRPADGTVPPLPPIVPPI
jgi:putative membrane protein